MPKPIKRSDLQRSMNCAEYDENIDRLLDRANHTGTQSCSTIFDLEICIRNMTFIVDLIKCCAELREDIRNIKVEIYDDNGQVFVLIQRLRTEIVNLINQINEKITDIQSILVTLDTRVDALEACCVALTNALNALTVRVTNVESRVETVIPIGVIMMWSGSIETIPSNFRLCDGTGGTPDLRGRFILGAGGSFAVNATGGSFTSSMSASSTTTSVETVGAGGLYADGTALSITNMPPHIHSNVGSLLYPGGTEYPIYGQPGGKKTDPGPLLGYVSTIANTVQGNGAPHFHTVLGNTAGHSHTLSITAQTINVANPYYALAFIRRMS